jgi:hypothetical protein
MDNVEKPSWKQWIPIYGVYRAITDFNNGKPSVIQTNHSISGLYHSVVSFSIPFILCYNYFNSEIKEFSESILEKKFSPKYYVGKQIPKNLQDSIEKNLDIFKIYKKKL